jgi:hypothetical protein
MKIYYSSTTKGFYIKDIHGDKMPADCVEITEEQHKELLNAQSNGKQIVPDDKGAPTAIDPIPRELTWEEIRNTRNKKLQETDWIMLGDANPKPSKEIWLAYRQALRDVTSTFSNPNDVVWPEKPQ